MKKIKRILRIVLISFLVLFIGLLISAHIFLRPWSDAKIMTTLSTDFTETIILNRAAGSIQYRLIKMQKDLDSTKSTLLFVHGSPGSAMDFKAYMKDTALNNSFNIMAYDRPGYGLHQEGEILGTLEKEMLVLDDILQDCDISKTVLIGYSYGGPVVLASSKRVQYKIALAASVSAKLEPQFWAANLCKWPLTRWMVPKKIRAAADEKMAHMTDLPNYNNKWDLSESPVLSIHGDKDWIVPYANSLVLQKSVRPNKFQLLTLDGGGHDLIWTNFAFIKQQLLMIND